MKTKSDIESIIGQKYNRLTILKFSHFNKSIPFYECICDCGNKTVVSLYFIKNGHTKSCGCARLFIKDEKGVYNQRKIFNIAINDCYMGIKKTNGWKRAKSYDMWYGMLSRCYDDKFHSIEPTYI